MCLATVRVDNMPSQKRAWVWLWLSLFLIVLDQWSKYQAVHHLSYGEPVVLAPFFNLWLKYNAGAAYGFLEAAGGWHFFFLSGISIIVSVIVLMWLGRIPRDDWMKALALSFILGGAIGNLIDRLRFRYVIDFFDFHIGAWHFATFNVADAAITVGTIFLAIRLLFFKERSVS